MKNKLAENMLRFGVKNLSESDINNIMEANKIPWNKNMGDPKWLNVPVLTGSGGDITSGYAEGVSYVQQYSYVGANLGVTFDGKIVLLPKGTQWTLSPSKYFLLAKGMKVVSSNFGYGAGDVAVINGAKDGAYIAKVAQGKGVGTDGKPVQVQPVNVAFTPNIGGVYVEGYDVPLTLRWPSQNLYKKLQSLGHL